jgi:hypothetical protein
VPDIQSATFFGVVFVKRKLDVAMVCINETFHQKRDHRCWNDQFGCGHIIFIHVIVVHAVFIFLQQISTKIPRFCAHRDFSHELEPRVLISAQRAVENLGDGNLIVKNLAGRDLISTNQYKSK